MRRPLSVLVLAMLVSGCQPSVSRQNYTPGTARVSAPTGGACPVVFQRAGSASRADVDVDVVGDLEVGDTGFSMNCARAKVLEIMRDEACSLGAHIVEVTREQPPDGTSTCYRARARLLRLKHDPVPGELADSDGFQPATVKQRSRSDSAFQWTVIGIAIGAGIAAGVAASMATQGSR